MSEKDGIFRRHAVISGRVQGVGFRWFTRSRAGELGLTGWVRNMPDGAVEEMAGWCHLGSPQARVSGVSMTKERPLDGERGFEIR
ncbi:MAG: acylphosphatase [Synergistaceae bacterium]|jgi:acylphosphatase|nr:acylphosphatase [Synergistaceae bacterium]